MKKILSLLTICALAASSIVFAQDNSESVYKDPNGYSIRYVPNGDGIEITKCIFEKNRALVIPKEIDGKKVNSLACEFVGDGFESVEIQADITEIMDMTLTFNNTVKKIVLNEGLKKIGWSFANNNTALTEIVLPSTLEEMAVGCFSECPKLNKVKIPDNLNKIGNGAFSFCPSLTDIEWDMTADECGRDFAKKTPWLAEYGKTHEWLAINNGSYIVSYVGQGGSIEVPKFEKINHGVCIDNTAITEVTSVYGVPDGMFIRCENLKSANIISGELSDHAFAECSSLSEIRLPQDIEVIPSAAFYCCKSLKSFDFPQKLKIINSAAFQGSGLENVRVPEGVTEIGSNAFEYCNSLISIHFPSTLTYLGKSAVYGCEKLISANIPDGVKDSLQATFWYCNSLENVECSEMTKSIYNATAKTPWNEKYAAESMDKNSEFFVVGDELKKYNGTDRNPIIPDGVKIICASAFDNAKIDSVVFPAGLEEIQGGAFYMSEIREVIIPKSVKSIGSLAFGECHKLESVEIQCDCSIPSHTFENCTALKNENVKLTGKAKIASDAFPFKRENITAPTTVPTASPTAVPTATPTPEEKRIDVSSKGGDVELVIDSRAVQFPDAKPFIDESDRTQIPIRVLSELLGFEVKWEEESRTAVLTRENIVITIKIGDKHIIKNGNPIEMDTEAKIIGDRTYIPLRFIAEALGCAVEWK